MDWMDTHCHLANAKFAADADAVIEAAVRGGVRRMVTLSTGFDDMEANIALARAYPGRISATVGVHPCDVESVDVDSDWKDALATFARAPEVAAIGETGLDYYHPPPEGWSEDAYRARQRELLRGHFEVAAATGHGIVLHTRDRDGHGSLADALAIARDFAGRVRPLFHCFLGPWELAGPILALDGLVSFGGIVTFPAAKQTLAAAVAAPSGTFMLETDAPYLAPVPFRGKRNEPAHVIATGLFLAGARQESAAALAAHTAATARGFFRFLPEAESDGPA